MTKAKATRLKVFQAQFGFYDSVVAATSQAAALRAWGTHQNLFADGQARLATDAAAMTAALACPNIPLRRALGTVGGFEVEPTALPTVPDAPKRAARPRGKARKTAAPAKPPPDRGRLDAAERALSDLDAGRTLEEHEYERRSDELEAEIAAARTAYRDRPKAAKATRLAAREAYRDAGGTD